MFRRMLVVTAIAVGLVAPMLNRPVLAHHSGAAYAQCEITLKGTVTEYDWGNPHVVIVWNVKDDSGATSSWSGELASVSSELADGMTKNSVKPGDDLIFTVKPAKSGSTTSLISTIKHADGSVLMGYSRRAAAGGQATPACSAKPGQPQS
jgi:hypothetical protein